MHDVDDSTTIGFNAGLGRWLFFLLSEELEACVSINTSFGPDFYTRNPAPETIGLLDSSHPRSIDAISVPGN
jgi:hypothetical protein